MQLDYNFAPFSPVHRIMLIEMCAGIVHLIGWWGSYFKIVQTVLTFKKILLQRGKYHEPIAKILLFFEYLCMPIPLSRCYHLFLNGDSLLLPGWDRIFRIQKLQGFIESIYTWKWQERIKYSLEPNLYIDDYVGITMLFSC